MSTAPPAPLAAEVVRVPTEDSPTGGNHSRNLGIALALISGAQLMVVLDATIVNIALPYIQQDLTIAETSLSWIVNSYTLAFGGLLLLGGRLGDILGRRRVFITGVLIFALASLLGGIAQSEMLLYAARILQGLGAAIASPTALALITTTFPAGTARNRAFAVYAAMSGAGAAVGLILGGALTELSWRWTFLINVPIGIFVAVLAPRYLDESARVRGRFDLPGAITGTAGLAALVYGLTNAGKDGWGDSTTVTFVVAGTVLLAVFLAIEARSTHALLPLRILQERNRAATYIAMLAVGSAIFSMFFFLSQYIQRVMGYEPLQAGFAFLPFSVGIVVVAQIASQLVSRVDVRWIAGAGSLVAAGGLLWFSRLSTDATYLGDVLGPMLLIAAGMALLFVPLTLVAVYGVPTGDTGVASAVLNTTQQIGGALGLATLSTVAASAGTDRADQLFGQLRSGTVSGNEAGGVTARALTFLTDGFTQAFFVGAWIVLGAAIIILLGVTVRHDRLATEDTPTAVH